MPTGGSEHGGGACMVGWGVMLTYGGAPGAQGVTWRCIQGSEARPPASRGRHDSLAAAAD